ncbi:docking protein 2-like [Polyodon spathula]|uniref:docking protein 2-like n=1 Tax=Polyodon spathula TaxID=7913 RepID=UPI001B7F3C23|nr:docking protein 2-like [Polyodon spathula]
MEHTSKEGMLYLQGIKFGKKSWKRTWLMLYPASSYGIGRVELFDVRDGAGGGAPAPNKQGVKKSDKKLIRLTDCISITPAPGETCPKDCTAFYLNTTQRTYALASENAQDWVGKLCELAFQSNDSQKPLSRSSSTEVSMEENELYSSWKRAQEFQVTVQVTEASLRCDLYGDYILVASKEDITLLEPRSKQVLYNWPYRLLRRFGQDKTAFMFEAGRRCKSGEGYFMFLSNNVPEIFRAMEQGIGQEKSKRRSASEQELETTPQHPVEDFLPAQEHNNPRAPLVLNQGGKVMKEQTPELPQRKSMNINKPAWNALLKDRTKMNQEEESGTMSATEPLNTVYATIQEIQLHSAEPSQSPINPDQARSSICNYGSPLGSFQNVESEEGRSVQLPPESLHHYAQVKPMTEEHLSDFPLYDNMGFEKPWSGHRLEHLEIEPEEDSPSPQDSYSLLKSEDHEEKNGFEQEEEEIIYSTSPRSCIVTETEISACFKQRLTNLFSKEMPKFTPPALVPRDLSSADKLNF